MGGKIIDGSYRLLGDRPPALKVLCVTGLPISSTFRSSALWGVSVLGSVSCLYPGPKMASRYSEEQRAAGFIIVIIIILPRAVSLPIKKKKQCLSYPHTPLEMMCIA